MSENPAPNPHNPANEAFPGATGVGATYHRETDSWSLYTVTDDGKCERFGSIDGYNRKRMDWIVKTLRSAIAADPPANPQEPVAYRAKYSDETRWTLTNGKPPNYPDIIVEPLFTAPPANPQTRGTD